MSRYLAILLSCTIASAQQPIKPDSSGRYVVNGSSYAMAPGDYTISGVAYRFLPQQAATTTKPQTTPPAPIDEDAPPAKQTTPAPTKNEIIQSIKNNTNLPTDVKQEILDGLVGTPPQISLISIEPNFKPIQKQDQSLQLKKEFNLLEAIKKTQTEFKPASPPQPAAPATAPQPMAVVAEAPEPPGFEVPLTDIGVSIGSKVDYTTPFDVTKPVPYGKLLQFWVKPVAKRPEKLKSVAYTWTVIPKEDAIIWPDTTKIVFSSGSKPQSYVVMLTASYVYVDGDKIIQKANQAITMVQVGELNTGTGTVTPKVPPTGLSAIAKQSYEWVGLVKTGTYTNEQLKADAKKLAVTFNDVATAIDKAQLTDVNDIMATTRNENNKILENKAEWAPWFTKMSDLIRSGYTDNTIRTPAQYAEVWREIAKGLEAAAK